MSIVNIRVMLCLRLMMGQIQLRVYRGTVVHSRELKLLQDNLLVYGANSHGEVIVAVCSLDT